MEEEKITTTKKIYEKIESTHLPNGETDIDAGALEMQSIFGLESKEKGRSIFIKALFKVLFRGFGGDASFRERLEISGLKNITDQEIERCKLYFSYLILAKQFNKTPKDLIFENGKYTIKKDIVNNILSKFSKKSIIAAILITVFGISLFNLTGTKPTSNVVDNNSNVGNARQLTDNKIGNVEEIDQENPPIKKSRTGICHPKGGTYYYKTQNFTAYASKEECLDSGGRMPRK